MKIAVIGLGYIGLPTAALLAGGGHKVLGYDRNPLVRQSLRKGDVELGETPVREAVVHALNAGTLEIVDRVPNARAYILCLPTPTHEGKPDLSYVEAAAESVAAVAEPGAMLVLESTVPPGTTERIFERALREAGKRSEDYCIAHCPERVIPGNIVHELRHNARVIGASNPEHAEAVRDIYASFCEGEISLTTSTVAEFVKVVENTFRDVNIAFANELAMFAEELGVDVWEAIALANKHPRVNILEPGPGVGGHCIPVDPHFLADANPFVTELIQSARRVNDRMPYRVAKRIFELVDGATPKKIALLGAAYKADVDDARETPTLRVDALLRERGYLTAIYDPLVKNFSRPLATSLEEAVLDADAVVLMTAHAAFRAIDPLAVRSSMRVPRLVDTRKFFDAKAWEAAGFETYVLGRPFKRPAARAVA